MTEPLTQGRRPRDRKQQILAAAAEQFGASGYHNVGVTEIADTVGITGAAVYRHFRGKQDLLLATLQDAINNFATRWAQYSNLDDLLLAMCTTALQRRDIGVLWERELVHLPPETQHELRAQFLSAAAGVRSLISEARPDLEPDAVDLLLWAVMGVTVSVGYHSVRLETRRFQARLLEATRAVCETKPRSLLDRRQGETAARTLQSQLLPATRREAVLTVATRLFTTRGYQAVGVDDIGAAAGITGATVYHHFASKSAILAAALTRCFQAMFFDLSGALDTASSPSEALDWVLRSFVRTSIEHGQVIGSLLNEIINLAPEEREALRQVQRDYVTEWVGLLVGHRSELSDAEAQVLVHATMSMVNSLLRIRHVRRRPDLDQELMTLGRAILGLDASAG